MAKRTGGDGWSFVPAGGDGPEEEDLVLGAGEHRLRVELEKRSKGKVVTVVSPFQLAPADLKAVGKKLKAVCGTGGSAKDGSVELQGDHRDKVRDWLSAEGWGFR